MSSKDVPLCSGVNYTGSCHPIAQLRPSSSSIPPIRLDRPALFRSRHSVCINAYVKQSVRAVGPLCEIKRDHCGQTLSTIPERTSTRTLQSARTFVDWHTVSGRHSTAFLAKNCAVSTSHSRSQVRPNDVRCVWSQHRFSMRRIRARCVAQAARASARSARAIGECCAQQIKARRNNLSASSPFARNSKAACNCPSPKILC